MRLSARHALVTGASRGIGAAVAVELASRGAAVTLVARSAEPLAELAGQLGGRILLADLAEPGQRADLIRRAEAAGGPIDVLVNVAGLDAVGSTLHMSADQMSGLFSVNLLAPAELCRQVLPGMLDRGRGHVVNVSSGFSTILAAGLTSYCSSKAGLSHFTAGLRVELTGTPVGVTLVELGPVRTSMYDTIEAHRLTGPALARLIRMRLAVEVSADEVARQLADGVEEGRAHVVLPRRMRPVTAFTHVPRSVARVLLSGLPRR